MHIQQEPHGKHTVVPSSSRKNLSLAFGWILTVIGALLFLFFVVGGIAMGLDAKAPTSTPYFVVFVGIVFSGPPIALGLFLLRLARKAQQELAELPDGSESHPQA